MSLRGSLDTVGLPDVLTLLATTHKSGELLVTGAKVEGHLWVTEGRLVASEAGRALTHLDAIFELLRIGSGTFAFEDGNPPAEPGEPEDIDPLLTEAAGRLGEWGDIATAVPSLDSIVRMVPDAPDQEVMVRADQWRLLAATGGGLPVQDVIDVVSLGEFDGCKALKDLVDNRLVSIEDPPEVVEAPEPVVAARPVEAAPPVVVADPPVVVVADPPVFVADPPVVGADPPVFSLPVFSPSVADIPPDAVAPTLATGAASPETFVLMTEAHEPAHMAPPVAVMSPSDPEPPARMPFLDASDLLAAAQMAEAATPEPEKPSGDDFYDDGGGVDLSPIGSPAQEFGGPVPQWSMDTNGADEPSAVEPQGWTMEPEHHDTPSSGTVDAAGNDAPAWTVEHAGQDPEPVTSTDPVPADVSDQRQQAAALIAMDPTGYLAHRTHAPAPSGPVDQEGGSASSESADEAVVAEDTIAAEEPINRGLLLKFLSSVRT